MDNVTSGNRSSTLWPGSAVVLGVLLVLLSQFALNGLSDLNEAIHWLQHGLLFVAGVSVGVGADRLYRIGQRRA